MPDPADYDSEEAWMEACIPEVEAEGKDHDQAVAQCLSMWRDRAMTNERWESRFQGGAEDLRIESRDDGSQVLHGAAPPYGVFSDPIGGRFLEMFEADAFHGDESDVIVTHEHDDARLLGRISSGTASVRDDAKARHYSVELPATSTGTDVATLQARGDLKGSSFEFRVGRGGDRWFENADEMFRWLKAERKLPDESARALAGTGDMTRRLITRGSASMRQIGPVATPAYPQFRLALRSLDAWQRDRAHQARPLTEWAGWAVDIG